MANHHFELMRAVQARPDGVCRREAAFLVEAHHRVVRAQKELELAEQMLARAERELVDGKLQHVEEEAVRTRDVTALQSAQNACWGEESPRICEVILGKTSPRYTKMWLAAGKRMRELLGDRPEVEYHFDIARGMVPRLVIPPRKLEECRGGVGTIAGRAGGSGR
eukprot:TRINITY_DN634_c0_g1_i1.p1 TRINITY_DN634_c0_g1~~TRINITY_DN634_c0_g1_i1.p1  ORF type:complete len:165 (-),score=33.64 TRINITY_DN634_c0_g1_i1:141-635(-)